MESNTSWPYGEIWLPHGGGAFNSMIILAPCFLIGLFILIYTSRAIDRFEDSQDGLTHSPVPKTHYNYPRTIILNAVVLDLILFFLITRMIWEFFFPNTLPEILRIILKPHPDQSFKEQFEVIYIIIAVAVPVNITAYLVLEKMKQKMPYLELRLFARKGMRISMVAGLILALIVAKS